MLYDDYDEEQNNKLTIRNQLAAMSTTCRLSLVLSDF